jgi:hypothetical protein
MKRSLSILLGLVTGACGVDARLAVTPDDAADATLDAGETERDTGEADPDARASVPEAADDPQADAGPPPPDARPGVPDAAVDPPPRARRAFSVVAERRMVKAMSFSADAPGIRAALERTLLNGVPGFEGEAFPDIDRPQGRWLAAVRQLPDETLVLDVSAPCGQDTTAYHVTADGARSLGRRSTASCAPIDTTTAWVSPDGRWIHASRLDDFATADFASLDTPTTERTAPACPGVGDDGGAETSFVAWEGETSVLTASLDVCLMRLDLATGAAEAVRLPSPDCRVVADAGAVAVRLEGRLLFDCEAGLEAVASDGTRLRLAEGFRWDRDSTPVTQASTGALLLTRDGATSVYHWHPGASPRLDPVLEGAGEVRLVADSRTGAPALVTFTRTAGEIAARLSSLGAEGPVEVLETVFPARTIDSVVVGDAAEGPLFVAARPWNAEVALWIARRGADEPESVAGEPGGCSVLPWQGEAGLSFWRCEQTSAVDVRGEEIRLWPMGHVLTTLTTAGSVMAFAFEAETDFHRVDDDGALRPGRVAPGAPLVLGATGDLTAVLRAAPRLGRPGPARVDLFEAGFEEAAVTLSVDGEVLGFRGGRVVVLEGGHLKAHPTDGSAPTTFDATGLRSDRLFFSEADGGLAFAVDERGALLRLAFETGAVRVIATGLPVAPLVGAHHDTGVDGLVLAFQADGEPVRLFALPADPDGPAVHAAPILAGDGAGFESAADGDGAIAWDDTGVFRLCSDGGCAPERLSNHFLVDDTRQHGGRYQVTPDGLHLVNLQGTAIALSAPDVFIAPRCEADAPCGPLGWGPDGGRMTFGQDGTTVLIGSTFAVRPRDGRAAQLGEPADQQTPIGAVFTEGGIFSAHAARPVDAPSAVIRLRFHDEALRPLSALDLPDPSLNGSLSRAWGTPLDGGAEFCLALPRLETDTTRIVAVDTRPRGGLTADHTIRGHVRGCF